VVRSLNSAREVSGGGTPTAAGNWLVEYLAHGCYQASDAEAGTVVRHGLLGSMPEWAAIAGSSVINDQGGGWN
jgi:hypothetical protein